MEWELLARVLEGWELKDSKLTREEIGKLFDDFRKEDPVFEDLVSERDKIVGIIETHVITVDALKTELKKWDDKIEKKFEYLRSKN